MYATVGKLVDGNGSMREPGIIRWDLACYDKTFISSWFIINLLRARLSWVVLSSFGYFSWEYLIPLADIFLFAPLGTNVQSFISTYPFAVDVCSYQLLDFALLLCSFLSIAELGDTLSAQVSIASINMDKVNMVVSIRLSLKAMFCALQKSVFR